MRANLVKHLSAGENVFEGIVGFEDTVIPDIERAILSRHNILLLGLRGQAKTRLARLMVRLLNEYIPVVAGSEINDDPLHPISRFSIDLIKSLGDDTPIEWMHRSNRYVEKLATPDVSIADLIGDVDPILAATLKLPFSDERVIHFGLIPRSHRCIFVINELPDLQARIQVALFNILQEEDIQIRGFKLRLPLNVSFVFTANPEDYTNRGSIITPLKDRIESQILTHYPTEIADAMRITAQEAKLSESQSENIVVPDILKELLERISFVARDSDWVDEQSGVSARLSISGYENMVSTAERRMLINKEKKTTVRVSDFWGVIPSITGKVELVYEGEQEGPYSIALKLIEQAMKEVFSNYFPNPDKKIKQGSGKDPYQKIKAWFAAGNSIELFHDIPDAEYKERLQQVNGLAEFAVDQGIKNPDLLTHLELILHGLSVYHVIHRDLLDNKLTFSDILAGMLEDIEQDGDE